MLRRLFVPKMITGSPAIMVSVFRTPTGPIPYLAALIGDHRT